MVTDPSVLAHLSSTAATLLQQGEAAAALDHCQQVLLQQPLHVTSLAIKAAALSALEQHAAALSVFRQLTELQPRVALHWMNLGTTLRATRQFDAALVAYARAGALAAGSADFYFNVGLLHIDRGDYESAREVLQRAHELAPVDAEICFHYAHCCNDCQQRDTALQVLRDWPRYNGLHGELLAKIALFLMNLGEPALAEAALARAITDPAPTPLTLLKFAQIYERTNRLDKAHAAVAQLRVMPETAALQDELMVTEAQLAAHEGKHERARALFEKTLARCTETHLRHTQLFPYAKSLDALQQHADAFAALNEAHRSQLEFLSLTAPHVSTTASPTIFIAQRGVDPTDVAGWDHSNAPSTADSPVFIVAFPRSGTTLLEQTLDAHPLLCSMDEQPFLQNAIDKLQEYGLAYPQQLGLLSSAQLQAVREHYWSLVRQKVQLQPGQRLLDKNPLNLLRLPAIHRLFPRARILLAIRHPCDVLLSCYMQHFTAPEFVVLCSSLDSLASGYRQSFDFWYQQQSALRAQVREIRYEHLVSNFADEVRSISKFLELPWHEAMLAPAAHAQAKGFISTPSYAQVTQPVNRQAVGRWQSYRNHFAAVLPVLQPYLQRWNYAGE